MPDLFCFNCKNIKIFHRQNIRATVGKIMKTFYIYYIFTFIYYKISAHFRADAAYAVYNISSHTYFKNPQSASFKVPARGIRNTGLEKE